VRYIHQDAKSQSAIGPPPPMGQPGFRIGGGSHPQRRAQNPEISGFVLFNVIGVCNERRENHPR
jgi:hypothetical protein